MQDLLVGQKVAKSQQGASCSGAVLDYKQHAC